MIAPLTWCAVGLLLLGVVGYSMTRERYKQYPPGPKGLPIVGNIFDVPKLEPWKVYQQWSSRFDSDIVYFNLMGTHAIVLNSVDVAQELLERRASIYSGRPITVMLHELTGWWRNLGLMDYGDGWRAHRRMFHQQFTPKAVPQYHPLMKVGVRRLLYSLADAPERFSRSLRFMLGSSMLKLIYGLDVQAEDDVNLVTVEKAIRVLSLVTNAGSYLVDVLPVLKYIPKWFPGAQFKRQAAEWKHSVDTMYLKPFGELKTAIDKGESRPCITATILARYSQEEYNEELEQTIINSVGTGYAGAVDTTVTTLNTFFQVMIQNPEAQAKAQDELDHILKRARLPELEDRDSLPYVSALIKEVFRWHPALPLSVMHKATADDVYAGYYIPAGTMVISNSWAILHDERRYPNPSVFDPTRFLTADGELDQSVPDPLELFGFGRRICPGRYFALDVTWLAMANVLSVFSIAKPLDAEGNAIEPSGEYESGFFSPPKPFKASIKPRFAEAKNLIRLALSELDD